MKLETYSTSSLQELNGFKHPGNLCLELFIKLTKTKPQSGQQI